MPKSKPAYRKISLGARELQESARTLVRLPNPPTRHFDPSVVIHSGYAATLSFRKIVIIGHQSVKPDWNKFKPTKAVKRNQYEFTQ
jgi:hypothetical protein